MQLELVFILFFKISHARDNTKNNRASCENNFKKNIINEVGQNQ